MLEDKIKATDWEATNEAIEEQVARESYLQWLRDNERRNCGPVSIQEKRSVGNKQISSRKQSCGTSTPSSASPSTVTSGELRRAINLANAETAPGTGSGSPARSPKPSCSSSIPKQTGQKSTASGQKLMQVASHSPKAGCSSERDSPKPSSSSSSQQQQMHSSKDSGFQLLETASFLNGLPPNIFGLEDWSEADVLTQVLAASQQEYLDSLKHQDSPEISFSEKSKTENQCYNQQPTKSQVKCKEIVESVSVSSKIPPQRKTGEVQNEEVNDTDSSYLPADLMAATVSNSEQPVVDIVSSACSENLNVINEEFSETSSRTKSPTPDSSSIKENTV